MCREWGSVISFVLIVLVIIILLWLSKNKTAPVDKKKTGPLLTEPTFSNVFDRRQNTYVFGCICRPLHRISHLGSPHSASSKPVSLPSLEAGEPVMSPSPTSAAPLAASLPSPPFPSEVLVTSDPSDSRPVSWYCFWYCFSLFFYFYECQKQTVFTLFLDAPLLFSPSRNVLQCCSGPCRTCVRSGSVWWGRSGFCSLQAGRVRGPRVVRCRPSGGALSASGPPPLPSPPFPLLTPPPSARPPARPHERGVGQFPPPALPEAQHPSPNSPLRRAACERKACTPCSHQTAYGAFLRSATDRSHSGFKDA